MTILYNRTALRETRKQFRNNPTAAEQRLWSRLNRKQILGRKFRRQYSVDAYVLDFYCPELKLAIEVDGSSHDATEAKDYDKMREKIIEQCGIKVLRFRNEQVMNHLDDVIVAITQAVQERRMAGSNLSDAETSKSRA